MSKLESAWDHLASYSDADIKAEYQRRFKPRASRKLPADLPRSCRCGSYQGERPKSAVAAEKIRRAIMEACECPLCWAALRPVSTFDEQTERMGRPYPTLDPMADLEAA